jgi:hypothetical protein
MFDSTPPPVQFERSPVVIAHEKQDVGDNSLFNRTYGDAIVAQKTPAISTGQIESMNVPQGWVARGNVRLPAGASLVEYHPPGVDSVRINSFYRGSRLADQTSEAFKNSLAAPPHTLQSKELASLGPLLGDKTKDFDIYFAKTEDLNGKRVLSVEGRYKSGNQASEKTIYADSDGSGSAVQEISYSAQGREYLKYLTDAENAYKSIVWK